MTPPTTNPLPRYATLGGVYLCEPREGGGRGRGGFLATPRTCWRFLPRHTAMPQGQGGTEGWHDAANTPPPRVVLSPGGGTHVTRGGGGYSCYPQGGKGLFLLSFEYYFGVTYCGIRPYRKAKTVPKVT